MADNEQQDDYLSNMLNALNEKEQESQSYNCLLYTSDAADE